MENLPCFYHEENKPLVTLAVTSRASSRCFLFDAQQRLYGWRNNKTGEEKISIPGASLEEKAFSGIHIISPEIFPLILKQGKFSIVDVYLELAASQKILGFDHSGSRLIDVGKPEAVKAAESMFL